MRDSLNVDNLVLLETKFLKQLTLLQTLDPLNAVVDQLQFPKVQEQVQGFDLWDLLVVYDQGLHGPLPVGNVAWGVVIIWVVDYLR